MRKYYCFRFTFWMQRELDYEDDGRLRLLFKDRLGSLDGDRFEIIKIANELYDRQILLEGYKIILRPALGLGWWNGLILWIHGFKRDEVVRLMRNSEIARVLVDFFSVNASWISSYFSFADNSVFEKLEKIPFFKNLLQLKNPLYGFPRAT